MNDPGKAAASFLMNLKGVAVDLSVQKNPGNDIVYEKQVKNADIDRRTQELIRQGAIFDGYGFSLSDNAQRNWIAIKACLDIYTALKAFPIRVTTIDNKEYSIPSASVYSQFATTMLMTVAEHYNSGRALKLQVNACVTIAQVKSIRDER